MLKYTEIFYREVNYYMKNLLLKAFFSFIFSSIVFVLQADPVAKVGETAYETLSQAFDAVEDGGTVTLIADVELTTAFTDSGSKTVSLDCGKFKLSSTVKTRNYTSIGHNAGENYCIIEGFNLIINGGSFSNLTFSAKSTENKTSTLTVNAGSFLDCELFAFDYNSEVVINGGDFSGGLVLSRTRTQHGNSKYAAKVIVNGGSYDGVVFYVRPYHTNMYDTMDIYSGKFTNCEIRACNGNKSLLTIGRADDTSELKFENCKIYSFISDSDVSYSYYPKAIIKRGDFFSCDVGANNNNAIGNNLYPHGTATIDIEGGHYSDCDIKAYCQGASNVKKALTIRVTIKGGSFTGGQVLGICGDAGSNYEVRPEIKIENGNFDSVIVRVRSCYSSTQKALGNLEIGDGIFERCKIITDGYVPTCTINGGVFNGCLIGSHMQQRFYEGEVKVTVNNMTANGCLFFAKVTDASGTGSNSFYAKAYTYINGGTFTACTKATYTDEKYTRAYVTLKSGVSLDDVVFATIGETQYKNVSSLVAALNEFENAQVDFVTDLYLPLDATYSSNWTTMERSAEVVEIPEGKKVLVKGNDNVIDLNFSVAGSLVLDGGYYFGTMANSLGGVIVAKEGTKFKERPLDLTILGSSIIKQDDNGDYCVIARRGFYICVQ